VSLLSHQVQETCVPPANPPPAARRAPVIALADITSTVYDTITVTSTIVELEEGETTTEYSMPTLESPQSPTT
jgi:hypothetical protein